MRPGKTALIYDPLYLAHDTGAHPECPTRLTSILSAIERRGLDDRLLRLSPRAAGRSDLERVHQSAMIERIDVACRTGETELDPDTIICPASFDAAVSAVGGALTAVDALIDRTIDTAFVLARPPGHHATPDRAMGFCLFNQVAVAARYAQAVHGLERVLILDWDVHHGNGTQDAFYDDPSVYYVSWHQTRSFPWTGRPDERGAGPGLGFTLNVPLPAYTRGEVYREVFRRTLEDVAGEFQPDLVILSAGFDAHAQDPLGGLLLEDSDYAEMTRWVLDLAHRSAGGRLLSVLEGGYNLQVLGDTVATHLEVFLQG